MSDITQILDDLVVPWITDEEKKRLIVARQRMNKSAMPRGVTLSEKPIIGQRITRRDRRAHANQRLYVYDWPKANLQQITLPKLACIIRGETDYLLGKYSVRCPAGNFILIPPYLPHQANGPFLSKNRQQMGSCDLIQTYAFSHGIRIWISSSRGTKHISNYADHYFIYDQDIADIFRTLIAVAQKGTSNWMFVCRHLLAAFFSLVAQRIKENRFTRQGHTEDGSNENNLSFEEQMLAYIEANCHHSIKLSDAAEHFIMSVSQLTRRMRQEDTPTFVEMLTDARIERAKRFLRETDLTFTMITQYCGFHSPSHFRTLFRRKTGTSPSNYRRNLSQNDTS